MVEVEDRASVKVLHHVSIAVIGPVLYLNLALGRLFHAIHEHASEVLTLGCQNRFVAVDGLGLYHKDHVCKSGIVDDGSHIADESVDRLIINFVFLKFTYIKDANIVEPLAAVESAKNKELFGSYNACGVSLSACWCFFEFEGVAPSHRFSVKHIKIV